MRLIYKEEHKVRKLQGEITDNEAKIKDLNFEINAFKDNNEKMKD